MRTLLGITPTPTRPSLRRPTVRALGAAVTMAVLGAGFGVVGGCDSQAILKCPPADPPMTAQYSDEKTITVVVSSSGNTGEMTFNLVDEATVKGGHLAFQDASKSLTLRIDVDPTAKEVTADVNATCTDGVVGSFTLVVQIPAAHGAGDYVPVVVRNY